MKNTLINKIVVVLLVATTFSACSDDVLDKVNPNQISTESFWKNLDDLNSGINAVYNALKNGNVLDIGSEYNRSDMTYPGYGRPNTSNVHYLQSFNDSNGASGKWAALYAGIFRANQVIAACERLEGTFSEEGEEERAAILAQARGLRGLFYFYLHSSFNEGSVPIYDFVPANETELFQPVSSATDVKGFFMADLEHGLANLPATYSKNNAGKLTAGACAALLGKAYLYAGDYANAESYFRKVINDYDYALTPDIGSNFTTRDELNQESILEINYSLTYKSEINPYSAEQTSSTLNFALSPVGGWRSMYPACWLIMEYKKEQLDTSDPRNIVTRDVYDETGNVTGTVTELRKYSLRTSHSVALVDDLDLDYYGQVPAITTPFNNGETSYWRKYTNWDIAESEKDISASFPRSGVNIRVIRLADVYLMLAECLIQGGTNDAGVDEALVYINKVRKRSGVVLLGAIGSGEYPISDHDNITYDANSLMEHLMYVERPLELSAEGHAIRAIDLRRWGIAKQRFTELAQKEYYATNFEYEYFDFEDLTEDGDPKKKKITRWGALLSDDGAEEADPIYKEFDKSAENYLESENAYWPIPNAEVTANPKLYDNQ
ncbi:RagB/SusD family nutrient uptake outer membrane protein [Flavicella sediminum]|uniref:RagB/SusD family nutrient uptake outer membrane protein n=1 Tax=Flavicella sediminum TaxID=2585141 RepID=UPI001120BE8A|nr:RagB/SusD family nutrient uptake outer membrane protein [Flavicella sediminum]